VSEAQEEVSYKVTEEVQKTAAEVAGTTAEQRRTPEQRQTPQGRGHRRWAGR
jgi:hypothetical protein